MSASDAYYHPAPTTSASNRYWLPTALQVTWPPSTNQLPRFTARRVTFDAQHNPFDRKPRIKWLKGRPTTTASSSATHGADRRHRRSRARHCTMSPRNSHIGDRVGPRAGTCKKCATTNTTISCLRIDTRPLPLCNHSAASHSFIMSLAVSSFHRRAITDDLSTLTERSSPILKPKLPKYRRLDVTKYASISGFVSCSTLTVERSITLSVPSVLSTRITIESCSELSKRSVAPYPVSSVFVYQMSFSEASMRCSDTTLNPSIKPNVQSLIQ